MDFLRIVNDDHLLGSLCLCMFATFLFRFHELTKEFKEARREFHEAHLELRNRFDKIERDVHNVHSEVFNKAEQILCFQESYIQKRMEHSVNQFVSSKFMWSKYSSTATNYSDWKISVSQDNTEVEVTYFVHRYILGAKSTYFENVFSGQWLSVESEASESCIDLHCHAFSAFPSFLDYLYTGKIQIKPQNAMTLLWLSNYFCVSCLEDKIMRKITPIPDAESCALYGQQAHELDMYELMRFHIDKFAPE